MPLIGTSDCSVHLVEQQPLSSVPCYALCQKHKWCQGSCQVIQQVSTKPKVNLPAQIRQVFSCTLAITGGPMAILGLLCTGWSTVWARSATPQPSSTTPTLMQGWSVYPNAASMSLQSFCPPHRANMCWTCMQQLTKDTPALSGLQRAEARHQEVPCCPHEFLIMSS